MTPIYKEEFANLAQIERREAQDSRRRGYRASARAHFRHGLELVAKARLAPSRPPRPVRHSAGRDVLQMLESIRA